MQAKIDKELAVKVTDSVRFGRMLKDEEYAGNSVFSEPAKNIQRVFALENAA